MLSELDHRGKTTPELFERINLRLALSVTARNALGRSEQANAQEIATMLYGEVGPYGHFRFVNFGRWGCRSRKITPIAIGICR